MNMNMLTGFLQNPNYVSLVSSIVLLIVFFLVYISTRYLLLRNVESRKQKNKIKARLYYILLTVFLMFMAKIWVVGFTHVFYGLSLVSAGLVVTNKETIMNFVGSLVITWRGLFSEGDYIEIGGHSGFVYELGMLYFKILQSSKFSMNRSSGKMIKIPNGLIINNPVINFSLGSNFVEYTQTWLLTPDSDLDLAKTLITQLTKDILASFYQKNERYVMQSLKTKNTLMSKAIILDVDTTLNMKFDKPSGIQLTVSYYCFPKDEYILNEKLTIEILKALQKEQTIHVSFAKD